MMRELIDAFDRGRRRRRRARRDRHRVAGAGFCAGADLGGGGDTFARAAATSQTDVGVPRDGGGMVSLRIFDCTKPVIGGDQRRGRRRRRHHDAADGHPAGERHGPFGFVFARRGIVPEACSSWFLPRLVGISQAAEWCYTGGSSRPTEALDGGLVRSVHAPDDLLPAARAIAREIADNTAPVSVALTRQMLWRMLGADHPMEAHRVDSRGILAARRESPTPARA